MSREIDEQQEREAFEEAVFAQYYLSGIRKVKNPGIDLLVPDPKQKNKEQFVARTHGVYNEETLNPAWWAWKTRAKQAARDMAERDAREGAVVSQYHRDMRPS